MLTCSFQGEQVQDLNLKFTPQHSYHIIRSYLHLQGSISRWSTSGCPCFSLHSSICLKGIVNSHILSLIFYLFFFFFFPSSPLPVTDCCLASSKAALEDDLLICCHGNSRARTAFPPRAPKGTCNSSQRHLSPRGKSLPSVSETLQGHQKAVP